MHVLENADGKDKKGDLTKENLPIKSVQIMILTTVAEIELLFTTIMVSFTLFLFNTQINNFDFLL